MRWEKRGGASRVRVTPELVDARPGPGGALALGQQFDASLTDVFQVQADIATKVADALGVALADSARRELTAKPTENLAAYDEFLKGEAASQAMSVTDPASLRRAIGFYERAVALDSTFVPAWAQLSRARTSLYPTASRIRRSASRRGSRRSAPAALKPERPDGLPGPRRLLREREPDRQRARAGGVRAGPPARARQRRPARCGRDDRDGLGRWDSAAARLARAALLDPRSASAARRLPTVQLFLRQLCRRRLRGRPGGRARARPPAMVSLKVMAAWPGATSTAPGR